MRFSFRRFRPALGLGCLFALLAPAAGHADSPTMSPDRVIDVVTDDWNSDSRLDRAVLVEGEPSETDLFIFVSTGNEGERRLVAAREALSLALARLEALSPLSVLARGYSITRQGGRVVRRFTASAPTPGQPPAEDQGQGAAEDLR